MGLLPPSPQEVKLLTTSDPVKPIKTEPACQNGSLPTPELHVWQDNIFLQTESVPWNNFAFPDRRLVPLSTYLEQVTILFLQTCNIRSRTFLEAVVDRYVASTLHVNKSETFQSLSREAYVRGKVDMWAATPAFRLHPRLTTAFVEESKGRALVFSTNSITGTVAARPELTREEVTVNHFERRKNGDWICTKFETVRGPGHWTFEVGHAE